MVVIDWAEVLCYPKVLFIVVNYLKLFVCLFWAKTIIDMVVTKAVIFVVDFTVTKISTHED
jgi:hypothetical protein